MIGHMMKCQVMRLYDVFKSQMIINDNMLYDERSDDGRSCK